MPIATYYDSPAKLAALRAATKQLLGTPFFPNSEAPGRPGGKDCVHLLNWLHRTCGAIDAIDIPRQTMDHGLHSDRSLLIEAFSTWPGLTSRFALLWSCSPPNAPAGSPPPAPPVADFLPGDTLCFNQGRVPHHGGVYLGAGEMLHTLKNDGAHIMHLNAAVRGWRVLGFLAAVYRPLPREVAP